jgi:hypothetical protein
LDDDGFRIREQKLAVVTATDVRDPFRTVGADPGRVIQPCGAGLWSERVGDERDGAVAEPEPFASRALTL